MLVLTRKAAEGVKFEIDGKVVLLLYFVPLNGDSAGINVVTYKEATGLSVSLLDPLSLQQTVQLTGLPEGIDVFVTLVGLTTGFTPKARLGIEAPDSVTIVRDELEDENADDETKAA